MKGTVVNRAVEMTPEEIKARAIKSGRELAASHLRAAANRIVEGQYNTAAREIDCFNALLNVLVRFHAPSKKKG